MGNDRRPPQPSEQTLHDVLSAAAGSIRILDRLRERTSTSIGMGGAVGGQATPVVRSSSTSCPLMVTTTRGFDPAALR